MSASLPAAPTLRRSPAKFKDTNVWTLSAHVFKKDWLTKAENHQQQPLNQKGILYVAPLSSDVSHLRLYFKPE